MEDGVKTLQNVHTEQMISVILGEVKAELMAARKRYPRKHASAHESYAILLEEVDEVWDAIKANDLEHAHLEMRQVAATAIRFLLEVGKVNKWT